MKRPVVTLIGALVLVAALTPAPGLAETAPTVTGPSQVGYSITASLAGTTPEPHQAVQLWFRAVWAQEYVLRRTLTSDDTGHFAYRYPALNSAYIFARADGVNSATITVRVPRASCSSSKPAFTHIPDAPSGSKFAYAYFSAVRGTTWAGVAAPRTNETEVFTWRGGTPHVLERFHFNVYVLGISMHPVGFAANYDLVAAMTGTWGTGMHGVYWSSTGHRHTMSHGAWTDWAPTGISDAGRVIGWADSGTDNHPSYHVVTWYRPWSSTYRIVGSTGAEPPSPQIDGQGDMAWTSATAHAWIHTANGRSHLMQAQGAFGDPWTSYAVYAGGASVNAFYSATSNGTYRWIVDESSPDLAAWHGSLVAQHGYRLGAVGRWNTITVGAYGPHIRTNYGGYTSAPDQLWGQGYPLSAIDTYGHLAYTSKADRRVHFLHCTTT